MVICEGEIVKQDFAAYQIRILEPILREDIPQERRHIAQPSKIPGRPIFKQDSKQAGERVGVAVRPLLDSQRPAMPVVSRDSRILSAKSR